MAQCRTLLTTPSAIRLIFSNFTNLSSTCTATQLSRTLSVSVHGFSCAGPSATVSKKLTVSSSFWSLTSMRYHWRPVPKKRAPYTKPVDFSSAGDFDTSIGPLNLSAPRPGFEIVSELAKTNENVKKVFSLEYSPKSVVRDYLRNNLLEKVKEHPLDTESLEVKIAEYTVIIRKLMEHCYKFRHDKVTKTRLVSLMRKRQELMTNLKVQDIDKFNWIIAELRINYKDDPTPKKLSKAEVRRRIAEDAAEEAKKEKVEVFRKALQEDRIKFEKFKETKVQEIEKELLELGVTEEQMTSLEATLEALGHGDLMPKAKPHIDENRLRYLKLYEKLMPEKIKRDKEILHANSFLTSEELPRYPDTKH